MAPIEIKDEILSSALELIGNTPMVALDRLHPGPGRILGKCEFMNPGGSIKCRSSLRMISKALESGELQPEEPVIELTSGNQGCGLAVVCAVKQHPLTVFMSEGNSTQRSVHMKALGAKCVRVPQVEGTFGMVNGADVQAVEAECLKYKEESGAFYVNQPNNPDNPGAHYATTGPEIWRQTGHHVDVFMASVGTGGTFVGTSRYLKEVNPNLKAFVIEPEGSEPIKGDPITKPLHLLQGVGYGMVPNLFDYNVMDGTISVTDEEALKYKQLIGYKEGLYVGYTSGANVAGAVKLFKSGRIPEDSWIVVPLNDTGLKYDPESD